MADTARPRRITKSTDNLEWLADFVEAARYARDQGFELTSIRDTSGRSADFRAITKDGGGKR
jgi:hypothetical protein